MAPLYTCILKCSSYECVELPVTDTDQKHLDWCIDGVGEIRTCFQRNVDAPLKCFLLSRDILRMDKWKQVLIFVCLTVLCCTDAETTGNATFIFLWCPLGSK